MGVTCQFRCRLAFYKAPTMKAAWMHDQVLICVHARVRSMKQLLNCFVKPNYPEGPCTQ